MLLPENKLPGLRVPRLGKVPLHPILRPRPSPALPGPGHTYCRTCRLTLSYPVLSPVSPGLRFHPSLCLAECIVQLTPHAPLNLQGLSGREPLGGQVSEPVAWPQPAASVPSVSAGFSPAVLRFGARPWAPFSPPPAPGIPGTLEEINPKAGVLFLWPPLSLSLFNRLPGPLAALALPHLELPAGGQGKSRPAEPVQCRWRR